MMGAIFTSPVIAPRAPRLLLVTIPACFYAESLDGTHLGSGRECCLRGSTGSRVRSLLTSPLRFLRCPSLRLRAPEPGSIPESIGDMKALSILFLDNNMLSGECGHDEG